MDRKRRAYIFTVVLLGVTLYTVWPESEEQPVLTEFTGLTMGSISYSIKVVGLEVDYSESIDSMLVAFNNVMSTYIPDSEISRFNKTSTLENPNPLFLNVLEASEMVYEETRGAFDPTIGPLINAWGFGSDKKVIEPDSAIVDSLLLTVGFEKVSFSSARLSKDDNVSLNLGAIAKGQAVDVVGEWLERQGSLNYMVEIGGEVRCRGKNLSGNPWRIAIQNPLISDSRTQIAIASLNDKSIATSGNYRNYYEKDGEIRAHIIDPMSGYTADHNLLSASVFHKDCMIADAYATAFMVMGLEASIELIESNPDLDGLLIYAVGEEIDAYVSSSFQDNTEILLE